MIEALLYVFAVNERRLREEVALAELSAAQPEPTGALATEVNWPHHDLSDYLLEQDSIRYCLIDEPAHRRPPRIISAIPPRPEPRPIAAAA